MAEQAAQQLSYQAGEAAGHAQQRKDDVAHAAAGHAHQTGGVAQQAGAQAQHAGAQVQQAAQGAAELLQERFLPASSAGTWARTARADARVATNVSRPSPVPNGNEPPATGVDRTPGRFGSMVSDPLTLTSLRVREGAIRVVSMVRFDEPLVQTEPWSSHAHRHGRLDVGPVHG